MSERYTVWHNRRIPYAARTNGGNPSSSSWKWTRRSEYMARFRLLIRTELEIECPEDDLEEIANDLFMEKANEGLDFHDGSVDVEDVGYYDM